jgi:hypothetical protein
MPSVAKRPPDDNPTLKRTLTASSTPENRQPLSTCLLFEEIPICLTPGQLFGLQCVLQLDDERRDSRFILVRALDR